MTKKQISPKDTFDKSDIFETKCREHLDELVLLCNIYRIPFFWTAATKNDIDGTTYQSDATGVASHKINLAEDKISKHLAVTAGFDIIANKEELEVIMDDFSSDDLAQEDLAEREE